MQRLRKTIDSKFGSIEGKYMESWKKFFGVIDALQEEGDHQAASTVLGRVLKTLVWSADAAAAASLSPNGEHRDAYADVTRFVEVWGEYTMNVASMLSLIHI